MSKSAQEFFAWKKAYQQFHNCTTDQIEDTAKFRLEFQMFLSTLPRILESLAKDASKASINPAPIIDVIGAFPLLQSNIRRLEARLDVVWNIAKQMDFLQSGETEVTGEQVKRDISRDKSKNFVPYTSCLLHPDEDVQAAAAHLNQLRIERGKVKALQAFFDERRTNRMPKDEAENMVEAMKKYEQRGRD